MISYAIVPEGQEPALPDWARRRFSLFLEPGLHWDHAYRHCHLAIWLKSGAAKLVCQWKHGQKTIHEIVCDPSCLYMVNPLVWMTLHVIEPSEMMIGMSDDGKISDPDEFATVAEMKPYELRVHDGREFLVERAQ